MDSRTGCGIGKDNGILDGDHDSSLESAIVVKKDRETGINTPFSDPVHIRGCQPQ